MKQSIAAKIKNAPESPGVYIFYNRETPIYIGKANSLKNRLRSYLKIGDLKTEAIDKETTKLKFILLRSEIEALIEESRLIKEFKPQYNILWRDDKSYLYVALTRQRWPKVFITHKNLKTGNLKLKTEMIGPFTDRTALRLTLKTIRRYFPYCTCTRNHLRDCLNAQMGKCFGFCCKTDKEHLDAASHNSRENSNFSHRMYQKNIQAVKAILRGQSKALLKTLKNEQERAALEKIFEHQPYINSDTNTKIHTNDANKIHRWSKIECYDISNFAGKEAVGAMTVLIQDPGSADWRPDKSQWRKFKIKSAPTRDDPKMIAEILKRRLNHPEWPLPNLIIIDGGITQYNAAKKVLLASGYWLNPVRLISFAKPQKKIIGVNSPSPAPKLQKIIEKAIYQTHNFVIRYHRKLRNKNFLN